MASIKAMSGDESTRLPRQKIHAKFSNGISSQMNGLFYVIIAFGFLMAAVFS